MFEKEKRSAPINIRCYQTPKNLIDRAAALQQKNRSDFILEAACREAEKEHRVKSHLDLTLSIEPET